MAPPEQQSSPYWKKIVGPHWPAIPPESWWSLAERARDGAQRLDMDAVARARREFDDSVRTSTRLQPVQDKMAALPADIRSLADALALASETFGVIAVRVRKARSDMLDVVDRALGRIGETDDPEQITTIVGAAQSEIVQLAGEARRAIGPQTLPELARIAQLLDLRDPWAHGGDGAVPHGGGGGLRRGDEPAGPDIHSPIDPTYPWSKGSWPGTEGSPFGLPHPPPDAGPDPGPQQHDSTPVPTSHPTSEPHRGHASHDQSGGGPDRPHRGHPQAEPAAPSAESGSDSADLPAIARAHPLSEAAGSSVDASEFPPIIALDAQEQPRTVPPDRLDVEPAQPAAEYVPTEPISSAPPAPEPTAAGAVAGPGPAIPPASTPALP
ncbi:MAG: hypothetical protein HOQ24_19540, partial [Mycobacteriaceae bacterium]|nr:hypothetical protein [Mycobacteriaceae bacterium]